MQIEVPFWNSGVAYTAPPATFVQPVDTSFVSPSPLAPLVSSLTPSTVPAAASQLIDELRAAYERGRTFVASHTGGAEGFLTSLFGNDSQSAIVANYTTLGHEIETWAAQAETNSSAQWSKWYALGKVYADAVRYQAGQSVDASLFTVVSQTADATVSDVATFALPALGGMLVLAGLVGVVVFGAELRAMLSVFK